MKGKGSRTIAIDNKVRTYKLITADNYPIFRQYDFGNSNKNNKTTDTHKHRTHKQTVTQVTRTKTCALILRASLLGHFLLHTANKQK